MLEYLSTPYSSSYAEHISKIYKQLQPSIYDDVHSRFIMSAWSVPSYPFKLGLRNYKDFYFLNCDGTIEDTTGIDGLVITMVMNASSIYAVTNEGAVYTNHPDRSFSRIPLPVPVKEVYCSVYCVIALTEEGELYSINGEGGVDRIEDTTVKEITMYADRVYVRNYNNEWGSIVFDELISSAMFIPLHPMIEDVEVMVGHNSKEAVVVGRVKGKRLRYFL